MEQIITPEVLGNFAVMSSIVVTATEGIKQVIRVFKHDINIRDEILMGLALFVSFVVVYINQWYSGDWSILRILLNFFNAIAVFLSATAGYRAVKHQSVRK